MNISFIRLAHTLLNIAEAFNPWMSVGNDVLQICSGIEAKLDYLKSVPDIKSAAETIEHQLEKLQEWWISSLTDGIKDGAKHAKEFLDKFIHPMLSKNMPSLKEAMGRAKKGGEYNFLLADIQRLAALPVRFPPGSWKPPEKQPEPPQSKRIRPRFDIPMQAKPGYPIPGDPNILVYKNPQPAGLLAIKLMKLANELNRRGLFVEAQMIADIINAN